MELVTPGICLAAALYFEARGEPPIGQIAVGQVILTRVKDKRWPKTVCKVVKQGGEVRDRCHFSFYCDGKSDIPTDQKAWRRAKMLAELMLTNHWYYDPTGGSNHYHNETVKPYWTTAFKLETVIGNHLFYKDKPNANSSRPSSSDIYSTIASSSRIEQKYEGQDE